MCDIYIYTISGIICMWFYQMRFAWYDMEGWLYESRAHPNDHLDYLEHAMPRWQTFSQGFTRNNSKVTPICTMLQNCQNCASTLFLYLKVPTTYPMNLVQLFFPSPIKISLMISHGACEWITSPPHHLHFHERSASPWTWVEPNVGRSWLMGSRSTRNNCRNYEKQNQA